MKKITSLLFIDPIRLLGCSKIRCNFLAYQLCIDFFAKYLLTVAFVTRKSSCAKAPLRDNKKACLLMFIEPSLLFQACGELRK